MTVDDPESPFESAEKAALKSAVPPAGATANEHRGPDRRRLKSTKLDRTLVELENAFDSWNAVVPGALARATPGETAPLKPSPEETAFKQRTKQLLHQLREQLSELSDD